MGQFTAEERWHQVAGAAAWLIEGTSPLLLRLCDEQMEEATRLGTLRSQLMLGEVEDILTDSTQQH